MTNAPTPKSLTAAQLGIVRGTRGPAVSVDPFRSCGNAKGQSNGPAAPSLDAVARGIIDNPGILDAVFRILAYTDPERLEALRGLIDAAGSRAAAVLAACKDGTFGAQFVAAQAGVK